MGLIFAILFTGLMLFGLGTGNSGAVLLAALGLSLTILLHEQGEGQA